MKKVQYIILSVFVAFILVARYNPGIAEWYAVSLYPAISATLSYVTNWIPFSLEEIFVLGAIIVAAVILLQGIRKKERWYKIALREINLTAWIVVWFYLGWGMNYFRESIYERASVGKQEYNEVVFKKFLTDYVSELNAAYADSTAVLSIDDFSNEIKELYTKVPEEMGLAQPRKWMRPKRLLFNGLYSSVGVLGYMGPFFNEIQLNHQLLPAQLPFCYAHELSHQLGVSNEDEANFWAYNICRNSIIPQVRYSGYFSLLPYVLTNASRAISPDEYKEYQRTIHPEILKQLISQQNFWKSQYSETLGEIQSRLYNAMLKGNKISSGTANYLQVVDMIIAFEYKK